MTAGSDNPAGGTNYHGSSQTGYVSRQLSRSRLLAGQNCRSTAGRGGDEGARQGRDRRRPRRSRTGASLHLQGTGKSGWSRRQLASEAWGRTRRRRHGTTAQLVGVRRHRVCVQQNWRGDESGDADSTGARARLHPEFLPGEGFHRAENLSRVRLCRDGAGHACRSTSPEAGDRRRRRGRGQFRSDAAVIRARRTPARLAPG